MRLLSLFALTFALSSNVIATQTPQTVNQQGIVEPGGEWLSYGRTYREQRFSPLDKINRDNIDELDLAWSFKFDTARGMEATCKRNAKGVEGAWEPPGDLLPGSDVVSPFGRPGCVISCVGIP